MADPLAPFRQADARLIKDSRTTTVAEMSMTVRGRPAQVIYKRFKPKKAVEWLLNIFRPTRAWRAWQAAQNMVSRGLPTPQNLAIIERTARGVPIPLETFLLTIKAEPSTTLYDYVFRVLPGLDPSAHLSASRNLTQGLADLLRKLHERSISDRDLKSANILVESDPVESVPRLSLIDLVGVQLCHPIPMNRRLQNLARLQTSLADVSGRTRSDSLRFLRSYLPWGLSREGDWKRIWREVARLCEEKRKRNPPTRSNALLDDGTDGRGAHDDCIPTARDAPPLAPSLLRRLRHDGGPRAAARAHEAPDPHRAIRGLHE